MGLFKKKSADIASEVFFNHDKLTALWCLRALLPLGGHVEFIQAYGMSDDVTHSIGIIVPEDWDIVRGKKKLLKEMQKKLLRLEKELPQANPELKQNIEWLSEAMCLSDAEKDILTFSITLSSDKGLEKCIDFLGGGSLFRIISVLSELLQLPRIEVQKAFSFKGILLSSGLISIEDGSTMYIGNAFQIHLMDGFAQSMQTKHEDGSKGVFQHFFRITNPGTLTSDNFHHIRDEYALIRNYVDSTRKNRTKGVNILIHGVPGTGKTQLVRSVAHELDLLLYEISMEDKMGAPYSSRQRFASYQLAQNIVPNLENAVIIFDEIEDVFPCEMSIRLNDDFRLKAWTNRMLEENRTPAFWLSNRIDQIDPAYLRRFDLIIELESPPIDVRHEMLQNYFGEIPHNPDWIKKLSKVENLSPSHIESAAKILSHLPHDNIQENERLLDKCLASKFKTFGIKKPEDNKILTEYRLDILNSDYPLENIVDGFKQSPEGRLCLYGPSGTGKSAFAHYLGDELGMPVMARKASDLLHPYVGGTEALISKMFEDALSNQAILLLDEADSFLKDRESAKASWEVTMVNELLVQMENFQGIFICTTNLADSLDDASIRRFDLKIKFDFLEPEQSYQLFNQEFGQGLDESVISSIHQRILDMDNLTPGDFALIKRQSRFLDSNISSVINSLEKESKMKAERNGGYKHIGFIN